MFGKLRKKIFGSIFTVILIFVLSVSIISFCVIVSNLYEAQAERTEDNAYSGVKGCHAYFSAVMGIVENASKNDSLERVLTGGTAWDIISVLDGICNYAVKVDGAVLYGYNGYTAYSAGVGSPPSLDQLREDEDFEKFMLSDEKSLVSVRKKASAQYYNHTRYNSEKGVISCMYKIYSGNEAVGIISADILPETLYDAKLSYISFGESGVGFLVKDGLVTDSDTFKQYFPQGEGRTEDGKYFVSYAEDSGIEVMLFVPLNSFYERAFAVFGMFFAVDMLLLSLGALFSQYVCACFINPLKKLYGRMNESR